MFNMEKTCRIYLRVSTDKQETERQKEELVEYAKYLGYEVVEILADIESGLKDDRPSFQKLLSYSKKDMDAVLVWEISRIGRKTSTIIKTIEDWASQGICFIAKKESLCSLDEDGKMNANTKLFLSIMATIAENEANSIKERMRSGKIHKLKQTGVYVDKPPFGYRKVDGKLVIEEEEANMLRKAFVDKKHGVSLNKIAKELGKSPTTTKSMLQNEAYKGIGRNKHVPDMVFVVPKIVDDALWDAVQATFIKEYTRTQQIFAPLRMKIVCPICGRHLHHDVNGKQPRYKCINSDTFHPKCSRLISARRIHELAEAAVMELVGEPSLEEMQVEQPENIKSYIEALEERKVKLTRTSEIARKKLEAVRKWLTPKEILLEERNIAKLRDQVLNIDVDIDAANVRLANSLILSAAPLLPMEVTGWWEYVKEVRILEYREGYKKLEIELLDNRTTQIEIEAHKGWSSVINKEGAKKPRGKRQRTQEMR